MEKRLFLKISLALSLVSAALMIFGKGVTMTFAPGPGEQEQRLFSYFDEVVFGYGDWFAPISGAFAVAVCVLLLYEVIAKRQVKVSSVFLEISFGASILSMLLFGYWNWTGILITTLLFLSIIACLLQRKWDAMHAGTGSEILESAKMDGKNE